MNCKYKNLFDLSGKTAIVTGGLGILGHRFCQGLAEFGSKNGFLVADWRAAVADQNGYLRHDFARTKVDLNPSGYQAVAAAIKQALESATH